jgi:hypothetical protein
MLRHSSALRGWECKAPAMIVAWMLLAASQLHLGRFEFSMNWLRLN